MPVGDPTSTDTARGPGLPDLRGAGEAGAPEQVLRDRALDLLEDLRSAAPDVGQDETQLAVEDALSAAYERVSTWT